MSVTTKRLLVAEDSPAISRVICFQLQQAGFQVCAALNGWQAREHLQHEIFDMVILDEQMPDLNGSELCTYMRTLEQHRHTPVVFLTAKALELDKDFLQTELGVTAVLSKPFSPSLLCKLCQETLAAKSEAGEC